MSVCNTFGVGPESSIGKMSLLHTFIHSSSLQNFERKKLEDQLLPPKDDPEMGGSKRRSRKKQKAPIFEIQLKLKLKSITGVSLGHLCSTDPLNQCLRCHKIDNHNFSDFQQLFRCISISCTYLTLSDLHSVSVSLDRSSSSFWNLFYCTGTTIFHYLIINSETNSFQENRFHLPTDSPA